MATTAIILANQTAVCACEGFMCAGCLKAPSLPVCAVCVITSYPLLNIFSTSASTCEKFCRSFSTKNCYRFEFLRPDGGGSSQFAHTLRAIAWGCRYRMTSNALRTQQATKAEMWWKLTTNYRYFFFFSHEHLHMYKSGSWWCPFNFPNLNDLCILV